MHIYIYIYIHLNIYLAGYRDPSGNPQPRCLKPHACSNCCCCCCCYCRRQPCTRTQQRATRWITSTATHTMRCSGCSSVEAQARTAGEIYLRAGKCSRLAPSRITV